MRKTNKSTARRQQKFVESLETRRLMSTLNVVDFGAKVNDGVDDTAAIRAAINASKSGDTIYFGGGTYNISDRITISSNRTYSGSGTLARPTGQDYIFKLDGSSSNITIDGLTFKGGGVDAGSAMPNNFTVKNCTFRDITKGWPTGEGILLSAGAKNTTIINNSFINIMGENGIYGFNYFENVNISNNYFDTVQEGIHLAYEGGGNGLYIRNNTFIRVHRMAVEIQGRNATNIYVEGNVASEWVNPYDGSFFLSIVQMGKNIYVRNNHASSGKFGQIDSNASNVPVGLEISGWGVTVSGNVIENFREGCHLMNIRDAVVENNVFWNQTWMAVWRTGISTGDFNGSNLTIQNNVIYGTNVTAFMFMGTSTGVIRNNTIKLFGNAVEYQGGGYNNVNKAGNSVTRMSGSKTGYNGTVPDGGSSGSGNNSGGSDTTVLTPYSPSGLQTTAVSSSQINLSWIDNSSNETGFKIQRRDNSTTNWVDIANVAAGTTSYQDKAANADTNYSYRVLAYNDSGVSNWSNENNAITLKSSTHTPDPIPDPIPDPVVNAPAAPTNLLATSKGTNEIDVTWSFAGSSITGFILQHRDNSTSTWVTVATLGADVRSYADTGVNANTNYSYRVVAYNGVGNSAWSNEHHAITDAVPVIVAPAVPTGVTAKANGTSIIKLTWTAGSSDQTGFKIQRMLATGTQWEDLATVGSTVNTYSDITVTDGTQYIYRVQAVNTAGASGWSTTASATTSVKNPTTPSTTAPAKPTNLFVTAIGANEIDLVWSDNSSNELGFKIQRRDNNTTTWVDIASVGANVTSYKDMLAKPGTNYSYRVLATNTAGVSGWSNEHNAVTAPGGNPNPGVLPNTPTGLKLKASYSNEVTVSWTDTADNETGFLVQRRDNNGGSWTDAGSVGANTSTFVDTAVSGGRNYSYRVLAFNDNGQGVWSNENNVVTPVGNNAVSKPTAPSAVTATAVSSSQINVSWKDNSTGELGFAIEMSTDGVNYVNVGSVGDNITSFSITGLDANTTFFVQVKAFNNLGSSAVSGPVTAKTLAVVSTPTSGTGTGLQAEYYSGTSFNNKVLTRTEGVNFNWATSAPDASVGADTFSVRWTGQIQAQYSENYTFYSVSDDGVRVWVDGKLIIDNWTLHAATENSGTISLEAGRKYDIKVEYYEAYGNAAVSLGWSSASQQRQAIPTSQLYTPLPVSQVVTDLAQGKTAFASSTQDNVLALGASSLTDGNDSTRWASAMTDNQWVAVDLGAVYHIDAVQLNWETAFGKVYEIQVSNDGKTWTTAFRQNNGTGGTDTIGNLNVNARFVRMYGIQRGYPAGFSLYSMQVFGTPSTGGSSLTLAA